MKRLFWVMAVVCLTAVSTVIFAACASPADGAPAYSVEGLSAGYEQNAEFSVEGLILVISQEGEAERRIALSDDMVLSAPDLTKTGKQIVKVCYEGEIYSFEIKVTEPSEDPFESWDPFGDDEASEADTLPLKEVQKTVDRYLKNLGGASDTSARNVKASFLLRGRFKGLGQELSEKGEIAEILLNEQEDAFAEYFRKAFADAIVSGILDGKISETEEGKRQADVDLDLVKMWLYMAKKDVLSDWDVWSALLLDSLKKQGLLDEQTTAILDWIDSRVSIPAKDKEGEGSDSDGDRERPDIAALDAVLDPHLSEGERFALEGFLDAVDQMTEKGLDKRKASEQAISLLEAFAERVGVNKATVELLRLWLKENDSSGVADKTAETVDALKGDAAHFLTEILLSGGFLPEKSAAEFSSILEGFIDTYYSEERNYVEDFDNLIDFLSSDWEEEKKGEGSYFALIAAIYADKALGYEVDYNTVFALLPLPTGIKEIDYNKTMGRVLEDKTADDIFFVQEPVVTYKIKDGRLSKAIVTAKARIAFDTESAGVALLDMKAEFLFRLEITL